MPSEPTAFPNLGRSSYLALTTYRRNGQPVTTPVWFARDGDRLLVITVAGAGKLKRISHTPRVTVAPCSAAGRVTGPAAEGVARVLSPSESEAAQQAILRRYGFLARLFLALGRLRGGRSRIGIAIVPAGGAEPTGDVGGRG